MLRVGAATIARTTGESMRLIAELRRRNVLRMAGLYLVGAWLATQVASTLLPAFDAPPWALRSVIVVLAIGFVATLVFSWVFELTPEGLRRDEGAIAVNPVAPATARRLDRAIIVVLACALVYFAVDKFVLAPRASDVRSDAMSAKSIAVMPLANTSGDAANEYFSDGMTEELITTLGKVRELTVIGRNASFRFKGKLDDPKAIAAQLGVAYLLEGSVRKAAEQVRISVDLVHAANGVSVWSETFDGDLADVFALQSRIAGEVARKLEARLVGNADRTGAIDNRPSNGSTAAHTALLQANFHANKQTEADYRKAIVYYDEAIRLDARYAPAYAGSSRAYSDLAAIWLGGDEARAAWDKARAAAQTALSLAPESSLVHQALADIRMQADFDLPGAGEEYRRAVALAPASAEPKVAYGAWLMACGRTDDAIALLREALALDPVRTEAYTFLGRALVAQHKLDEAEAIARKGLEIQPEAARLYTVLTEIALLRGDAAKALAEARAESAGFWRVFATTLALQKQGDAAAADAALQSFVDAWSDSGGSQIAMVHGIRDEPDAVFEWLDRAYAAHDTGAVFAPLVDPFLLKYRNDPRFATYLRKVGLTPDSAH